LQQEYFHTPKACLDLYFEIVMNMKNHERRVETSVCFHAKNSKDSIHSIILEKKGLNGSYHPKHLLYGNGVPYMDSNGVWL